MAGFRFQYAIRGSLLLYVGGALPPGDQWDQYVADIAAIAETHKQVRMAVFTAGGAPTPMQRRAVMAKLNLVKHRAAVITDSAIARTVVTVFAWLGSTIHAFAPSATPQAYAYLDASTAEREWLDANYAKFITQIADKSA